MVKKTTWKIMDDPAEGVMDGAAYRTNAYEQSRAGWQRTTAAFERDLAEWAEAQPDRCLTILAEETMLYLYEPINQYYQDMDAPVGKAKTVNFPDLSEEHNHMVEAGNGVLLTGYMPNSDVKIYILPNETCMASLYRAYGLKTGGRRGKKAESNHRLRRLSDTLHNVDRRDLLYYRARLLCQTEQAMIYAGQNVRKTFRADTYPELISKVLTQAKEYCKDAVVAHYNLRAEKKVIDIAFPDRQIEGYCEGVELTFSDVDKHRLMLVPVLYGSLGGKAYFLPAEYEHKYNSTSRPTTDWIKEFFTLDHTGRMEIFQQFFAKKYRRLDDTRADLTQEHFRRCLCMADSVSTIGKNNTDKMLWMMARQFKAAHTQTVTEKGLLDSFLQIQAAITAGKYENSKLYEPITLSRFENWAKKMIQVLL